MLALVGFYVVLIVVSLVERRWTLSLYWSGALILQTAVMMGMK